MKTPFRLWTLPAETVSLSLLPTVLFLGVFFFVPLVMMFGVSFATRGTYGGLEWVWTLTNYSRLVDSLYGTIFLRSVGFAGFTTLLCFLMGFPLAYVIARAPRRWQAIWLILVMIPFWTNFLVRTYAWFFILRADGLINVVLLGLGIIPGPVEILFTDAAVLVGLVYGYLPFMVLPLVAAIERIPPFLEEAAGDLYAAPWTVMWRVIVPMARPGMIAGGILVFISSLGAFITPYLLGGGHSMMMGTLIQQEFLVVRDWPFGSALAFVLIGVVFIAVWTLGTRVRLETQ